MQKCISNGHLIRYQGHKSYGSIMDGRPAPEKQATGWSKCCSPHFHHFSFVIINIWENAINIIIDKDVDIVFVGG